MSTSVVSFESSFVNRQRIEIHAHKLSAPTSHVGSIWRQEILEKVLTSAACRLVFLQGPAGYGKSTALAQLKSCCEANDYLTVWLTLDEADNDPERFATYFDALLAPLELTREAVLSPNESPEPSLQDCIDELTNRLHRLSRPVGIFLDELQCLSNPALLAALAKLFARLPANVCFFVASRVFPSIGLARLLVGNHALVFRASELKFSLAEAESFLVTQGQGLSHGVSNSLSNGPITKDEIESIYTRTEGWPAALQLFKLSGPSRWGRTELARQPRELTEYLLDNVFAPQCATVRDFLLRTAPLPRLTADLCNGVTGRTDSQAILEYLERSGLFVRRLDACHDGFGYHPLFAAFLQDQLLAQSHETVREVHRAAAAWHRARSNFEDALHHAVECMDFAAAADALNAWCSRLIPSGQLTAVEHWLDRLPVEEITKHIDLTIKVAYALIFLRRRQKAEPFLEFLGARRGMGSVRSTTCPDVVLAMAALAADDLEAASALVDGIEVTDRGTRGLACFESAVAANLLACRCGSRGQFEASREYLGVACSQNDLGGATFSEGYTLAATCIWQILQGELPKVVPRCRDYLAGLQSGHVDSLAAASVAASYVWALYEGNELELAQQVFRQYQDTIAASALPDFLVVAFLAAARTEEALGSTARAEGILDQLEGICYRHAWTRLIGLVNWERVRRALASGAVEDARVIAAHCSSRDSASRARHWLAFSEDFEGARLVRIRLAIHAGDFDVAAARLKTQLKRKSLTVFQQIKLHQLNALLQHKRRARDAARRALQQALRLAAGGRYVRAFIEEGPDLLSLVQEEHSLSCSGSAGPEEKCGSSRQFLRSLLQACTSDSTASVGRGNPSRQSLTNREKSILLFLADGVSNHDIAERIFVSQNTVKFHLKNIYSKLGVRNRIQAISSARALGLMG